MKVFCASVPRGRARREGRRASGICRGRCRLRRYKARESLMQVEAQVVRRATGRLRDARNVARKTFRISPPRIGCFARGIIAARV